MATAVAPEVWIRAAALAPLALTCRARSVHLAVWLIVAAAAYQGGAELVRRAEARPAATVPDRWRPSVRVEHEVAAVVRVLARPRPGRAGRWSAPAALVHLEVREPGGGAAPEPGDGLYLRGQGSAPPLGALLAGDLTVGRAPRSAVPGGFDMASWLDGRGLQWTARLDDERPPVILGTDDPVATVGRWQTTVQRGLRDRLARALPHREASVASSVLLGGGSDADLRAPFAQLGLAHLFALSGLHVGILAGLVLVVMRPAGTRPEVQLAIVGPLLLSYVVLVDLPGSVVRAAGLVLLTVVGPVAGRRVDSLRILGLLLWANLSWLPGAALDTGLRLSYLAAGGIVAGQRLLEPVTRSLTARRRGLARGLGVTVSAQLATLPEIARSFGFLPLAGPLANLLLVPVFGLAVTLLASGLAVTTVWSWAGGALLACGWLVLRSLSAVTALAAGDGFGLEAGLPDWSLVRQLGYLLLIVTVVVAVRANRRSVLPIAVLAYCGILVVATWQPRPAGGVDIWQFDVGQGDCALVRMPDGWQGIIDTGPCWRSGSGPLGRELVPWLRRRGIGRLDAVVLTHGHADHTGGRRALADAVAVDCWYPAGAATTDGGRERRLAPGDMLHAAGGWSLVCLYPDTAQTAGLHENDHSLVLGLCRKDTLVGLWTGDLEKAGEAQLIGRLPPIAAGGIDVWKAGHHGSSTSGSQVLLDRVRPGLVVISCGVANRHGHPSHEPYVAAAETSATLRTDLQGTVHLRWSPEGSLDARAMRPLPSR